MTDPGKRRLGLRNQGYADGLAGRPARLPDAEYQRSWRRGKERREAIKEEVRPTDKEE